MNSLVFITLILAAEGGEVRINCDKITMIQERSVGAIIFFVGNQYAYAKVTSTPADIEHMCTVAESVPN